MTDIERQRRWIVAGPHIDLGGSAEVFSYKPASHSAIWERPAGKGMWILAGRYWPGYEIGCRYLSPPGSATEAGAYRTWIANVRVWKRVRASIEAAIDAGLKEAEETVERLEEEL